MKLSIFYDHIYIAAEQRKMPIEEVFAQAKAVGISAVEIELAYFEANREEVLAHLDVAGFKISCFYEFYDWGTIRDIEHGKRQVDTAAQMGAERILVVPGFVSEEEAEQLLSLKEDAERFRAYMDGNKKVQGMVEQLRELVTYAAESASGVQVTLEDFDGKTAPFATANGLRYFMEMVPGLKFTMDCGNFAYSDEDALVGYDLLKQYAVHVHCKDRGEEEFDKKVQNKVNKGLRTVPVGGGYMPIAEVVTDLRASGYEGYYAIEHFGADDQFDCMIKSAEYLRGL